MKRQLIFLLIIPPLLGLFSSLEVYAQPGDPHLGIELPKPKSGPAPKTRSKRAGLTISEFALRYGQIYTDYKYSKVNLDETVTRLEELAKLTTDKDASSTTNQFLGLLYLHGRNDVAKAETAMERTIKANGSAIIEISFDKKWREIKKSRSSPYDFEDKGLGWIKISPGKIMFTDRYNNPLKNGETEASLTGGQIKELSKTLVSAFPLVEITTDTTDRPYIFAVGTMRQDETDLVIKLIRKHVMSKGQLGKGQLVKSRR